jgi:hypothetical protein
LNGRENLKDREKRRDCSKDPQNMNGKELKETLEWQRERAQPILSLETTKKYNLYSTALKVSLIHFLLRF